jgi:endogenous inhibitor of DNA gyrase (YacG/DUF329 family)
MSAPPPQDFDNPLGVILIDAMSLASCPGQANMNTNHATLRCPHCGKPMQFMQLIRKQGGLPELRTLVCENCQTVVTTEAQAKDSAHQQHRHVDPHQ